MDEIKGIVVEIDSSLRRYESAKIALDEASQEFKRAQSALVGAEDRLWGFKYGGRKI